MHKFEELHVDEQNRLLITVLEAIAAAGVRSIEQVAEARDMTVDELWSEICADAGLDECTPWSGYPARPEALPPARGGDRTLTDEQQEIAGQVAPAQKN